MKTRIFPIGRLQLNKTYNHRGFTLLELLIVISIIGLFSTFLALRIEGFFSVGALREAAKMIASDIGSLRAKAAYTHLEQRIVFNVDKESYHIILKNTSIENNTTSIQGQLIDPVITKRLPAGIDLTDVMLLTGEKIQEGNTTLRFFPNGSVQSALLHLKNDKGEELTLEINPLTGHVTIHDTYIEKKSVN